MTARRRPQDRPGEAKGAAPVIPAVPAPGARHGPPGGLPGGVWTLAIPGWRPTFDNELKTHPLRAHRLKKRDVEVIGRAAMALGVPPAVGRRRLRLTIRNRFGSFPDDTAPLKSIWDALKRNGLIVDDSREWLEFVWPPTYERGEKQTTIVLEDIGPMANLARGPPRRTGTPGNIA